MTRLAYRTTLAAVLLVTALPALAAAAGKAPGAFHGQDLAGLATIDLAEARSIALKARPGEIVDQELEKESGGSGLRYTFDIKASKKTYEVGVDAADGKILENAAESPMAEALEAAKAHLRR